MTVVKVQGKDEAKAAGWLANVNGRFIPNPHGFIAKIKSADQTLNKVKRSSNARVVSDRDSGPMFAGPHLRIDGYGNVWSHLLSRGYAKLIDYEVFEIIRKEVSENKVGNVDETKMKKSGWKRLLGLKTLKLKKE
jgi:hypothetical protein